MNWSEWMNSILTEEILSLLKAKNWSRKLVLKNYLDKQSTALLQKYMKVFLRIQLVDLAKSLLIDAMSSCLLLD